LIFSAHFAPRIKPPRGVSDRLADDLRFIMK
jgi:hypothetical protein